MMGMPDYTTRKRNEVAVYPDKVTRLVFTLVNDSIGSSFQKHFFGPWPDYKIKIVPGDTTVDRAMPRYNPDPYPL
jgi:hypothetical protein